MAKRKKQKKPNVYKGSYDVASGKIEVAQASYRAQKTEIASISRSQLRQNTFAPELRKFGIVSGGLGVVLVACYIVFSFI